MDFKRFKEKYIYGRVAQSPKSLAAIICREMCKQMSGLLVGTIIVICWYTMTSLMGVHQIICFGSSVLILIVCTIISVSQRAKCVYCLAFFRFCSSRSVLLTAMMYLAATVPFHNITKNFDAISESYTCIKDSSKRSVQAYSGELNVIKDQINNFTASIMDRIKKIRERYDKLLAAVDKARHFLDSLSLKCSQQTSRTYEHCLHNLDNAYAKCKRRFWLLCKIVYIVKPLCRLAKVGKILCTINAKFTAWIKNTVARKIDRVFDDIHDKLFVEVNVTTSTEIRVNKSKTLRGVKADIKQDMDEYLWPVLRFFMSNLPLTASLLAVPWIILRSHNYVARYVSDIAYDNTFLDYEVEQIDAKRKAKDKATVLPLETWETDIYIDILTPRLSKQEVSSLRTALVRVVFIVLAVISLFYIDLGLYSLVSGIRLPMHVGVVSDSRQFITVEGNGSMKQLLASVENITNTDHEVVPDLSPCLPVVSEPDYQQYSRIAIWCVTYGLFELVVIVWRRRLFHVVAAAVFPERQKVRAQWLVLHILAERRLLHHTERLTRIYQPLLFSRLHGNIFFLDSIMERSLPMKVQCWSCNYTAVNTKNEFRLCLNLGCKGVYCLSCLAILDYECPLCKGEFFFDHI